MWHASVAPTIALDVGALRVLARKQIEGLGDASLGEWEEWSGRAYHVRRRLSEAEATQVGPVVDVRGTYDGKKRLDAVRRYVPEGWPERIGEAP